MPSAAGDSRTFRLPRSAYLAVLFLIFCALPISFTGGDDDGSRAVYGWRMIFLLLPVLAAVFIARTATFVTPRRRARARRVRVAALRWDELRGLSVQERAVYAVLAGRRRPTAVRTGQRPRDGHAHQRRQAAAGARAEAEVRAAAQVPPPLTSSRPERRPDGLQQRVPLTGGRRPVVPLVDVPHDDRAEPVRLRPRPFAATEVGSSYDTNVQACGPRGAA